MFKQEVRRGSRCPVNGTGQAKGDDSLWAHQEVVLWVFVTHTLEIYEMFPMFSAHFHKSYIVF